MATSGRKSPSTQAKPAKQAGKSGKAKKADKTTHSDAAAAAATPPPDRPAPAAAKEPQKAATRIKRIRGTFAMPKADYERIAKLKLAAKRNGTKVKKNELLRLGLQALQKLTGTELNDRILALRVPRKPRRK